MASIGDGTGATGEQIFFASGGISVTKTLARINDTSYPIANIGSVRVEPNYGVAGCLFLIIAIVGFALGGPIIGIVVLVAALFIARYFITYKVIFRTSSGDQSALSTSNQSLANSIKGAIEQAVAARG